MHGEATNTADVSSYLGRSTTVGAGANAVNFTATSHSQAYADGIGVAASAGFAGQGLFSTADLKHSVSAFTDLGGSITAGNHLLHVEREREHREQRLRLRLQRVRRLRACAVATGGAVALGTITFVNATATDAPTVKTYVGSGTQLTATGAVSVVSNVKQKAVGRTNSANVGVFGAGLTRAHALALGVGRELRERHGRPVHAPSRSARTSTTRSRPAARTWSATWPAARRSARQRRSSARARAIPQPSRRTWPAAAASPRAAT